MPFRYDESDPQILVVYTGDDHDSSDYRDLMQQWVNCCQDNKRFGVLIVNEPHTHDHEAPEHQEQESAKLIKLLNDFRRDYRQLVNIHTVGYANIYDPNSEWLIKYLKEDENGLEKLQTQAMMRANYMFGTRGYIGTDIHHAKQWIKAQFALPPIDLDETPKSQTSSNHVGLFYGSTSGVTEMLAYQIQEVWNQIGLEKIEPINIGNIKDLSDLLTYDYLILGVPTWNIGQLQDDWEIATPQLEKLDFVGKKVALFGAGDQYGYADNFLDAIGILGKNVRSRGATLVGFQTTDTYEFASSLAHENDMFIGLGIDEIHQSHLTSERIESWVKQIIEEFELQLAPQA